MIILMAIYFGIGLAGMVVSLLSLLGDFSGHAETDAAMDHGVVLDSDHDFALDAGHELDHDISLHADAGVDYQMELDHDADIDHGGGHLDGKFSLTVISLAISIFGFAGLLVSALIKLLAGPLTVIPGVDWGVTTIGAFAGLAAIPFAAAAWYIGAKFYTLLKRQETPTVSGLRHAIGYEGNVQTAPLKPGSTGKIQVNLPNGEVITGFAQLADGFDSVIPVGGTIRVLEVIGDTAIVKPEGEPYPELKGIE